MGGVGAGRRASSTEADLTEAPLKRAEPPITQPRRVALTALGTAAGLYLLSICPASSGEQILLPAFSVQRPDGQLPDGWSLVTFRKISRHSRYQLVREGDSVVVRAQAEASAAALATKVSADLRDYPILHWRWKVDHVLDKSDLRRKHGDDYAARIYVTFAYDPGHASFGERLRYQAARLLFGNEVPFSGINYVWDSRAPIGTIAPNAYTDRVRMFVVESGTARVGRWVEERRNVYEDYLRAFGAEPPPVSAVAIMTDTDDTGESVTAWYGDITLERSAP